MKHPQPHFLSSLTPSVCRKRLESVSPPSSSAAAAAMSHNYPYRRPQPDSGLRSDPGSYVSSGRRHSSPDRQIYQAPQESYSYPSSSSRVAQWSRDGAVNILSSCGLEPDDLALLAEIPEDRLTVETLPQVLQQIKGKRGTVRQYAHNAPSSSSSSSSYPPSSTRRPIVKPTTSDWDRPPSQMLQYQVDQVKSSPPLPELDRWGNPITFSSVRAEQTPSSSSSTSSSYVVDFHHRPAPPDYGKNCRDTGPVSSQDYSNKSKSLEFIKPGREGRQVTSQDYHHRPAPLQFGRSDRDASPASSQDYYNRLRPPDFGKAGRDVQVFPQERPSFSSVGRDRTSRPFSQPGPADYRPPPLLEDSHLKPLWGGSGSETLPTKSSSQPSDVMPSKQNAMDFHGTTPSMYPHSCSLCAITVMSEKVWLKHINGPHHADGQLSLLQKFPNWDCRLETVGRVDNQPERWKDDRKPGEKPQTSSRNSNSSQQHKKKASEKSKVVCVKFPAHSVDEKYLKKLAEPFGRIVKILIFPSLAFVELGSMDQAKDMVKFHGNYPPTVNGQQMEFTISHTFNFLQSSRVVSFTPPPTGEDGQSDLISIIKRFGSPLYTLFLPSKSFVEMKETSDAQKLVDYYSSNSLRINDDLIKVSFSGEYKSLMRVPSANRYEEETRGTRSSSKDKEEKKTERDRKRSSRDRDKSGTRNRSRSREKSDKERSGGTRSKSKEETSRTRSRSRDKSRGDRGTRTRSKSKEKDINEKKSESKEESSRERSSRSESDLRENSVKEETKAFVTTESSSDPDPFKDSNPETAENPQMEEEAQSSADESDIEGMEVIGEDGESLQDEEMETLDDADEAEEEEERDHKKDEEQEAEETAEKDECPAERTDSLVEDQEKNEENHGEADDQEEEEKKEESDHHEQQEEKQMEEEEQQDCLKEDEIEEENLLKQAEEAQSTREAEEMMETQPEEDESDFPVDLDSCITLDELEEDECDYLDEEVRHESESPASRVLYLKNVPLDFFSDVEFIRLVRGYGTAVHFFRIPGRHSGFIEMSSSSEAQRAIKGLKDKPVRVNGSRIYAMISSNYTRLSKGWTVGSLLDSEEENKSRSQGSRRSERLKKPADRDEPSRKSEGRKQSSKKTPEKESSSRKSEEKESRTTRKRSSEKESASKQNPEKVSRTSPEKEAASKHSAKESHDKKSEENESASKTDKKRVDKKSSSETDRSEKNDPEKTSEKSSRRTPERESSSRKSDEKESKTSKRKSSEKESKPRKSLEESSDKPTDEKSSERESKIEESGSERSSKRTPETESKEKKSTDSDSIQTPEKDSGSEMSQNKTIKRKGARENDSVPEKKGKKNESEGESEPAEAPEGEELEIQETPEPGLKESGSPHPPGSTGNPAKLKCEQKPDADGLKDSEVNMESQSEPTGGAVELQKPTKPVGSEFVRPVVGYFCNLCQLIYADEDEAKQQHCSSLEHYRKYQEKTGKDPWAS
ncbi:matrin 3-like 1.1 isoform X1 [Labrus bergylta]|uniref:matrin 3-like 1.1 isoform X1 n=2 Tax=Labrus bergylta TaxID=56723 RepID=UPI003313F6DF